LHHGRGHRRLAGGGSRVSEAGDGDADEDDENPDRIRRTAHKTLHVAVIVDTAIAIELQGGGEDRDVRAGVGVGGFWAVAG
jgi:hypothetical protein